MDIKLCEFLINLSYIFLIRIMYIHPNFSLCHCPLPHVHDFEFKCLHWHYGDVIKVAIASQITSLTIVYSIVYSDADQRKHQSAASLAFVRGITAQMASSAENVSMWWRHHGLNLQAHPCAKVIALFHIWQNFPIFHFSNFLQKWEFKTEVLVSIHLRF